jgi:hypothetical protein
VFTIIRKFTLTRGSAGEVVRRVQDGFVPLLRELPGFRSYYLFDGGPEVLVSIRVFDSVDEALSSNEVAAEWMRNNVLEFTKGMPEVMAGHVLVAEAKWPQRPVFSFGQMHFFFRRVRATGRREQNGGNRRRHAAVDRDRLGPSRQSQHA